MDIAQIIRWLACEAGIRVETHEPASAVGIGDTTALVVELTATQHTTVTHANGIRRIARGTHTTNSCLVAHAHVHVH